jgi:hypothetical protein
MRIRQVLINLMANAAKFTEEGVITVEAKTHTSSTGIQEVLISVRDTGPGISQEDQTKLFQAFSQVDSSPTRKSGGTGSGTVHLPSPDRIARWSNRRTQRGWRRQHLLLHHPCLPSGNIQRGENQTARSSCVSTMTRKLSACTNAT